MSGMRSSLAMCAVLLVAASLFTAAPMAAWAQEAVVTLSAKHSGKCLDVSGASSNNGAPIIQWDCNGGQNQQWRLVPVGSYYRIVARHSGKCLDVTGASRVNGAQVIQWDCHGGDNQLWSLVSAGGGYYRITAKHSGKCLDVQGASSSSGTRVIQWDCHGADNQLWMRRSTSQPGKTTPRFSEPVAGVGKSVHVGPHGPGKGNHFGPDLYAVDYCPQAGCVNPSSPVSIAVRPALAGRVVYSGWTADYGYIVAIRHWDDSKWDKKYYSIYAHLTETGLPRLNALVDPSTTIGYMGNTGSGANGVVHLHFAVRYSDKVYSDVQAVVYGKDSRGAVLTPPFNVRAQFGYR